MAGNEFLNRLLDNLINVVLFLVETMVNGLKQVMDFFGLESNLTSNTVLTYLLAVIILAALMSYALKIFGRWIVNSIVGLALWAILFYVFNINIPFTLFNVIVVAAFGVPGLLALLVLYVGGVIH